ncbi:MAG: endonuclease/exonuclease/phosphatase family protein [Maribacter sp.]
MRKTLYVIVHIVAILLAGCTILSVFRNTENRYLKMVDFPRIQFFIASILTFIALYLIVQKWKWYDSFISIGLAIGLFVNGFYLINYTTIVPVEVPWANDETENEDTFSLLVTNVKMSNKNAQPLLDLVNNKEPDLILAMEVNQWWGDQLSALDKKYPYPKQVLNEVAYGMTLYSKFPLENIEVNYLNNKDVPSIVSLITLPNGQTFTFYSVHPVPPTHFKDLPDNEGEQEQALKKLGKMFENSQHPVLVAGDLNDVVWSHVDKLTGTKGILFDVRVGRGFYNSYNAENYFIRWPLDHVFVSQEFELKTLIRLEHIDSDHFPIYAELVLK